MNKIQSLNKEIKYKSIIKTEWFDRHSWKLLPEEERLQRMVILTNKLLDTNDVWADNQTYNKRDKRVAEMKQKKRLMARARQWKRVLKQNG